MDQLKDELAAEIQAAVMNFRRRGLLEDGRYDVSVEKSGKLTTQIRIKTPNAGTRYFLVSIKERF